MSFVPQMQSRKQHSSSGYAEVSTNKIIACCESTLLLIQKRRAKLVQDYVDAYIESSKWWHRWFGYKLETEKEAIKAFELETCFDSKYHAAIQKLECELLLKLAQATDKPTMFVSTDGLKYCNYK